MATPSVCPRTQGGGGLGTPGIGWGSLYVTNVNASSTSTGGTITLSQDDGAVMADTHRLGAIEFKGAENASNTLSIGARIQAVARGTWAGSDNDANLEFYTTDATTESKVLTLNADKQAIFAGPVTGLNYRTMYIDAGAMVPQATNGAAAGTDELATNDVMMDYFAFDKSTAEFVQFKMVMPEQWDRGAIRAKFYYYTSVTSGDVNWKITASTFANDDPLDAAFGATVGSGGCEEVDDTAMGVAGDLLVSGKTGDFTPAGSPSEGDLVVFRVSREPSQESSSANADLKLVGVNIQYKETASVMAAW